jgi:outer membrane protein assembly factor BamB
VNGVAESAAPVQWNDGKNIAWRTPIPGRGFSTPVIAGDRLFLTTAVSSGGGLPAEPAAGGRRGPGGGAGAGIEHRFVVMAISRSSGKVLWEQTALTAKTHEGYHRRYGSFASYAPVTDGKQVWALFGSYGLYCYTVEGKLVWKKEMPALRMRNAFGEGGAPVLAGSRLIVKLDQEAGSFIAVFDKDTGKEIWKRDRDEQSSWSTPLVVKVDGREQIITSATNKVRAYALESGEVVWECGGLGSNVIPAPVQFKDTVIVMSGHRDPNLLAIRLGRKGDLTGSDAILYTNQRGNPYTGSPVLHEGKLYFVSDSGMVSCLDAATGKPHYLQQRLPKPYNFKSSPVAAGGNLYLAAEDGDVVVLKLGEQFEVLATNTMVDQFFVASPVVVDSTLYLRSSEALYSIRN